MVPESTTPRRLDYLPSTPKLADLPQSPKKGWNAHLSERLLLYPPLFPPNPKKLLTPALMIRPWAPPEETAVLIYMWPAPLLRPLTLPAYGQLMQGIYLIGPHISGVYSQRRSDAATRLLSILERRMPSSRSSS